MLAFGRTLIYVVEIEIEINGAMGPAIQRSPVQSSAVPLSLSDPRQVFRTPSSINWYRPRAVTLWRWEGNRGPGFD